MSIELTMPELTELKPKISVIGVGGAGGNAVNNMINAQLQGVEFVAANTDAQALSLSQADVKIQLGAQTTQGLGAGSRPDVGRAAAEENLEAIEATLNGCHMAFITAGMGGGTGTGGAPVVAKLARDRGILTVGVITKPFQFEGSRRQKVAEEGIAELQKHVDTLIIIPNQNLFRIANEKTTFQEAFSMADEVLHSGVRGITDLMVMPGLINLDFADVNTVMSGMGKAMMGTGEAEGENRAREAADAAISNPLLDETSMKGAKGVIINITGGTDLTLFEVDEAANHIRSQVDNDANIIVGSAFMEELNGKMRVSVVATGVGDEVLTASEPEATETIEAIAEVADLGDAPEGADIVQMPSTAEALNEALANALAEDSEAGEEPFELDNPLDDDTNTGFAAIDDAFVPAAPMEPESAVEPEGAADPFAEAAMANAMAAGGEAKPAVAQRPTAKKRDDEGSLTMSLFKRLTGAARETDGETPTEQKRAAGNDDGFLGGMTPEDRPAPASENDALDIPSFLKRRMS